MHPLRSTSRGLIVAAAVLVPLGGPGGGAEREQKPELLFHKVGRGDVTLTVVERGEIEAAHTHVATCRLRARGGAAPSTVKWVIDDGTIVKKGDRLLELDSSALEEQ